MLFENSKINISGILKKEINHKVQTLMTSVGNLNPKETNVH